MAGSTVMEQRSEETRVYDGHIGTCEPFWNQRCVEIHGKVCESCIPIQEQTMNDSRKPSLCETHGVERTRFQNAGINGGWSDFGCGVCNRLWAERAEDENKKLRAEIAALRAGGHSR